jgi:hypothetical protein
MKTPDKIHCSKCFQPTLVQQGSRKGKKIYICTNKNFYPPGYGGAGVL